VTQKRLFLSLSIPVLLHCSACVKLQWSLTVLTIDNTTMDDGYRLQQNMFVFTYEYSTLSRDHELKSQDTTHLYEFAVRIIKCKGNPILIRVFRLELMQYVVYDSVINPALRCNYFQSRPRLPAECITVPLPVPDYRAWWQRHMIVERLGVKPATFRSRVRHPDSYTTMPY